MIISLSSLPPSVNRARTIHKRGAKRFIGSTDEYRSWIEASSWQVAKQTAVFGAINGAFRIDITVTRPDKRRRDLDNLLKATLDACVKGGAIKDDSDAQILSIAWIEEGPPGLMAIISKAADPRGERRAG